MNQSPEPAHSVQDGTPPPMSSRSPEIPSPPSSSFSHPRRRWLTWVIGGIGSVGFMTCCLLIGGSLALMVKGYSPFDFARILPTSDFIATPISNFTMATDMARAVHATSTALSADATAVALFGLETVNAQDVQVTAAAQALQATDQAAQATIQAKQAMLIEASKWPALFQDDFTADTSGWTTGDYDGERVAGSQQVVDGKYRWEASAKDDVHWRVTIPGSPNITDLYLAAEGGQVNGAEEGQWGIVFRKVDDDNFYYFQISQGQYKFSLLLDDDWQTLIDWTPSDAIRPGESNRLAVVAQGSHFSFFVGDQYLAEADDSTFSSGNVGMAIELSQVGDQGSFEFDNIDLRQPPETAAHATSIAQTEQTVVLEALQWPILMQDDFSSDSYGWPTGEYDGELLTGERRIADGRYSWQAEADEGVIWRADLPGAGSVADFYLAAEATIAGSADNVAWGLVFREGDSDNYYVFQIRNTRQFRFRLRQNEEWFTLIPWTGSFVIQPNGLNRLAVVAQGSHFTFFINDQYVGEADESALNSGAMALAISLFDAGDQVECEFESMELRAP